VLLSARRRLCFSSRVRLETPAGCFPLTSLPPLQSFSQKSRTPTVAKEFQIGLYDPAEADLEHFWNCCSAGFLGERLYLSHF